MQAWDPEEENFGVEIDLERTKFFMSYTYEDDLKLATFICEPSYTEPSLNYTFSVTLFNLTDGTTFLHQSFEIEVMRKDYVKEFAYLEFDKSVDLEFARLAATKFAVESVSRLGLVKVSFSQQLNPPREEDGFLPFNETERGYIWVTFTQNFNLFD